MAEDTGQVSPYVRADQSDRPAEMLNPDRVVNLMFAAYRRGRLDGDLHELRAGWAEHREPRLTYEQRVAVRIAEYTEAAEAINARLGRPAGYRYRGGAVDWWTGLPSGSACAWLRSTPQRRRRHSGAREAA